jgi:dTDP-4-dehydrorhamnose 3,5-epimerase
MIFRPTPLSGPVLLELERREDVRGFFARTFCTAEFANHGLPVHFPQHNLSHNHKSGTLRGLHFQGHPHEETKVVRCIAGAAYDVIVDLRSGSPTRGQWYGVELSAANGRAIFVPVGFAHGFQTLCDGTDLLYLMGSAYVPDAATGIRWNDPALAIDWPLPVSAITERDAAFPLLDTVM